MLYFAFSKGVTHSMIQEGELCFQHSDCLSVVYRSLRTLKLGIRTLRMLLFPSLLCCQLFGIKSRGNGNDSPNIFCRLSLTSSKYHQCQTQNRTDWGWITSCNSDTAQVLLITCDGNTSKMALIIILLGLALFTSITLSMGAALAVTKGLRRRRLQELPLRSFESNGLICFSCVPQIRHCLLDFAVLWILSKYYSIQLALLVVCSCNSDYTAGATLTLSNLP